MLQIIFKEKQFASVICRMPKREFLIITQITYYKQRIIFISTRMLPDREYKYLNYKLENLNINVDTNNKTEYFI